MKLRDILTIQEDDGGAAGATAGATTSADIATVAYPLFVRGKTRKEKRRNARRAVGQSYTAGPADVGTGVYENTEGQVEAHGYVYNNRDQRVMWNKIFASSEAAHAWADSKNATILSMREVKKNVAESTLKEYIDPSEHVENMAMLAMLAWIPAVSLYQWLGKIVNYIKLHGAENVIKSFEKKGIAVDRATYERIEPLLDELKQELAVNKDGTRAKALAKQIKNEVNSSLQNKQGVAEATGDQKFDKMLKGITSKRAVTKQQKADTKQQARDAFGSMFGGGNPANRLGIKKKDVEEGVEQNPDQVRQTLNAWMNQDQSMNAVPTQRAGFQAKVWPYIEQNIKTILADRGEDGKGSYPAAPYAAWLLVQHMDAYPQNQGKFLQQLEQSGLDPTDGKDGVGKLQFLKDRYEVNKWIAANANNKEYFINDKPLPNPTVNVRNPAIFKDAGIIWTSRQQALDKAIEAGNKLLVAAVNATKAKTQPSYKSNVAEGNSGAKYKVKSIGHDSKGDYYISPNTGKKVYKKANVGDHETPNGELKPKVRMPYKEGRLNEFAPGGGDDGEEETLHKYARMWYNGDFPTQQRVEAILDRMGWEIGELESEEGGAFVVQAGDINGRSYIGFSPADLTESVAEAHALDNESVIYRLDTANPMSDTEVLMLGGAGRYTLKALRNKARKEARTLADDLESEHGGSFRDAAVNIRQLTNTLNTIVAAYNELRRIRQRGGRGSRGITDEHTTFVRECLTMLENYTTIVNRASRIIESIQFKLTETMKQGKMNPDQASTIKGMFHLNTDPGYGFYRWAIHVAGNHGGDKVVLGPNGGPFAYAYTAEEEKMIRDAVKAITGKDAIELTGGKSEEPEFVNTKSTMPTIDWKKVK